MEKESLRAQLWVQTWNAVATASNSTKSSTCTVWADEMLREFDR